MKKYVLFNTAINVDDQWFLPFQQYELVEEVMIPLVSHVTRSGWSLTNRRHLQPHYVIMREGIQHTVPAAAGVLTDFEIPEEYVNRNRLHYERGSDNIKDYIKAAAMYLNIEIRYRPETSAWYREQMNIKKQPKLKEGAEIPKDIETDAANQISDIPDK